MSKINLKRPVDKVLIILFAILAGSVFIQYAFNNDNDRSKNLNNKITQQDSSGILVEDTTELNKITVDFGDGRQINQNIKASTPLKALEEVSLSQGYKIVTKQYKYGFMVEEINRVKNAGDKYWAYSVNGDPGKIAADLYNLAPGDKVEWKYTSAK